jgi:hypothetical protein
MVDRNSTVARHYPEQLRLLGPVPATDAGANRRGHRNRLTRQQHLPAQGHRVCQAGSSRSARRRVRADVDTPTGQPGCKPGILALATDGE